MSEAATVAEVETMLHMLGANSRVPGFRNYGAYEPDDAELKAMLVKGLVAVIDGPHGRAGLVYYHVVPAWKRALLGPALRQHETVIELRAAINCEGCETVVCDKHGGDA